MLLFDAEFLHALHVDCWHSLHNHLLPFFTRIDSGTGVAAILANLLAHDECNDIPQPQHELNNSAVPVGPFVAVPRHSTQILVLLVCKKKQGDKQTKKNQIKIVSKKVNLFHLMHFFQKLLSKNR